MIIEINNINYGYKKNKKVIHDLSIKVEQGAVYGFLGPNGAGKTTTIKLMLGLLKPSSGDVKLFSKSIATDYLEIYKSVGTIINSPTLYEHLSAKDNLEIYRLIRKLPHKRITEVLNIVQLEKYSKMYVKHYSTGMKQRLGIAIALLSDPALMILDEPTNGLDPKGIIEIRETIIKLRNEYNKTIFLSSHLLSEVEKLATHVGIIKDGNLLFHGSMEQLNSIKNKNIELVIETDCHELAKNEIKQYGTVKFNNGHRFTLLIDSKDQIPEIIKMLVCKNINVYQIFYKVNNLEDLFLDITNEGINAVNN